MKRAVRYLACIMALGMMFTICYYASYKSALKRLREMETKQNVNALLDDRQKQAEQMFSSLFGGTAGVRADQGTDSADRAEDSAGGSLGEGKPEGSAGAEGANQPASGGAGQDAELMGNAGQDGDAGLPDDGEEVSSIKEAIIVPKTKIVMEILEVSTGEFQTQEIVPDSIMIGMTRQQLSDYLAREMADMPVSEYEKGLYASELITFSENKVIIRKSYDAARVDFKYYLAIKNGEVIVYYSDRKTVYEYTGIKAIGLEEEARLALLEGVRVKDSEELFALLESYSS
ncbi:MAG: hypothetical protein K2N94_05485 [Lachnospiraceae bacterium]|nr:hypothetical protein [Lachnospiraceae bacterium]